MRAAPQGRVTQAARRRSACEDFLRGRGSVRRFYRSASRISPTRPLRYFRSRSRVWREARGMARERRGVCISVQLAYTSGKMAPARSAR